MSGVSSRTDGRDEVDAVALARELAAACRGEVRFSDSDRALYSTDASNYRQLPLGVVVPRTIDDVVATVELCRRHGASMFMRGAGTSLAGQCCNSGVVVDTSKYLDRLLELDPDRRTATVEPGIVCDTVRDAAGRHGLTFGPDPATHDRCTVGGMVGNNSCGVRSVWAGKTVDNVEELEILTYRGLRTWVGATPDQQYEEIVTAGGERGALYRNLRELADTHAEAIRSGFPRLPRRVSGYNLDELLPENGFHLGRALVGSESTCAVVLRARVKLIPAPRAHALAVLGFPDIFAAADRVPQILAHAPIGLEGMDAYLVHCVKTMGLSLADLPLLPEGGGWLLAEFGGQDRADARRRAEAVAQELSGAGVTARVFDDPGIQARIWLIRKSALGATSFVPGQAAAWAGWEDSAVPPERLGEYLRCLVALMDSYGYRAALYGHFGDGCIHTRIPFDLRSAPGITAFKAFVEEAADLVLSLGGSLSGEHGDGQARGFLLPRMFGPRVMQAFREFKAAWDPDGQMNPGKLLDADPVDSHLRLGTGYRPDRTQTVFEFPQDPEGLAGGAMRCVGVGRCRSDTGLMCPSYMVTREEKHSTRGRARLLFELLQEGPAAGAGDAEGVKDALDLCLACKGCKSECPVNVDMATYKAEFLSRYYRGRLRPASAYSMGLIHWWLRAGSALPGAANAVTSSRLAGGALKKLGGIAPERRIPRLAGASFRRSFLPGAPDAARTDVLLWPDTFNAYLNPPALNAAAAVLAHAGCRVSIPQRVLCCGRPLYDFGMLRLARRLLRATLDAMEPHLSAGTPVVVLEPGCLAVFRDELVNLLPGDPRARRLHDQSFTLAEFLAGLKGYRPASLQGRALLHGHCHQKSLIGTAADQQLLQAMGLEVQVPDTGCCGMAGAFGFEQEHYEVSVACGERVLLPAVREAPQDQLLVADGFSCREQIAQLTGRTAVHLAQVIQRGMGAENAPDAPN